MSLDHLVDGALSGNQRSLSRLATIIERQSDQASAVRQLLRGHGGNAHVVGVTGPPGVGKSSILGHLAIQLSDAGKSVAVIAVDPTSPLSGGATLGDRIRMPEAALRPNVFIRSLASRSRLDGLAPAALDMIRLFDAAGSDFVFLETVGSGQNQVEIANHAQTLVLVEAPGAGDSVQMLKAGIMELADVYAVNKADLPGSQLLSRELRSMISLNEQSPGQWQPRIVLCSNETGEGFAGLMQAIDDHGAHLRQSGSSQGRHLRSARAETINAIHTLIERYAAANEEVFAAVAGGEQTPEDAAETVLKEISKISR